MRSAVTAFVGISARFLSPGHSLSAKSPERTCSCTHSCPNARRRARPMPARRQMPVAALLSAQTSRAAEKPRAWATAASPRPSAAPLTMPANRLRRSSTQWFLRDRPMLDGVHSAHAHFPARGPPGKHPTKSI
eukprot:13348530-Alexandrium_andersonii.AAC.1